MSSHARRPGEGLSAHVPRPSGAATITPERVDVPYADERSGKDRGWNVVVWNDPVNLMSYVVLVFRRVFGYSEDKATRLMLEVHNEGRSVVSTSPREKAEMDCFTLHRYTLWATVERA